MTMKRSKLGTRVLFCSIFGLCMLTGAAFAHPGHEADHHEAHGTQVALRTGPAVGIATAVTAQAKAVSGQGNLQFEVLYTSDHLPKETADVLVKAHGGFAVDRRKGRGEIYFTLPGAGIIQISSNLKKTKLLATADEMRDANMHNTALWLDDKGTPFLTFPSNQVAKVFTTTLDGKLLNVLDAPTVDHDFDNATVNAYFDNPENKFVPTDVEQLDGLLYITTGYSTLDYVLTASVDSTKPFAASWYDLVFGGKGEGAGQFGTGHGITLMPDGKHISVADRPRAEIDRFTRYGHYIDTVNLPEGAFPCDVDYQDEYTLVGCLHGPNRDLGAPIYILKGNELLSTVMPKAELGLENFQHIHNAVLVNVDGTLYIIAQAWNPGDFAILKQVK